MVKHELRGNSTLGDLCVFACSAFYLTTWHNIQQFDDRVRNNIQEFQRVGREYR